LRGGKDWKKEKKKREKNNFDVSRIGLRVGIRAYPTQALFL